MRHPIAAVLVLATLAGCGSPGPSTPPDATASFSVSALRNPVIPYECDQPNCGPAAGLLLAVVPVRVTESGGIIGGYVTRMDFVMRDAAIGSVLATRHYDAAQISSMTLYRSNQVYPSAWLEIVAHPFSYRIGDGESRARTITVAITITDYRGNEHHQTLTVSVV